MLDTQLSVEDFRAICHLLTDSSFVSTTTRCISSAGMAALYMEKAKVETNSVKAADIVSQNKEAPAEPVGGVMSLTTGSEKDEDAEFDEALDRLEQALEDLGEEADASEQLQAALESDRAAKEMTPEDREACRPRTLTREELDVERRIMVTLGATRHDMVQASVMGLSLLYPENGVVKCDISGILRTQKKGLHRVQRIKHKEALRAWIDTATILDTCSRPRMSVPSLTTYSNQVLQNILRVTGNPYGGSRNAKLGRCVNVLLDMITKSTEKARVRKANHTKAVENRGHIVAH